MRSVSLHKISTNQNTHARTSAQCFTSKCVYANAELELKRQGQLLLKYFETKSTGTLAFISGNSCSPKTGAVPNHRLWRRSSILFAS